MGIILMTPEVHRVHWGKVRYENLAQLLPRSLFLFPLPFGQLGQSDGQGHPQSAQSFRIRTWTVHTLFVHADPSRKCRFNSFCVVAVVVEHIQAVFCAKHD